jgi:hypothetical protein
MRYVAGEASVVEQNKQHMLEQTTLTILSVHTYVGYKRYYNGLRDFLTAQSSVADKIELIPLEDRGRTGNFEVTVVDTKQILHSKTKYGQGRAESDAEKMAILEQIEELLDT